jgi:hypothetical protein
MGDLFGGLSYSAVSKVNTRFSEKLEKDRKNQEGCSGDHKGSVTSQGLTHSHTMITYKEQAICRKTLIP